MVVIDPTGPDDEVSGATTAATRSADPRYCSDLSRAGITPEHAPESEVTWH